MRQRDHAAQQLSGDAAHVAAHDPLLLGGPLRGTSRSARCRPSSAATPGAHGARRDTLVRVCAAGRQGRGEAFRANRAMGEALSEGRALCRKATSQFRHESAGELLRDLESLEGLCNNHLHNFLLETSSP